MKLQEASPLLLCVLSYSVFDIAVHGTRARCIPAPASDHFLCHTLSAQNPHWNITECHVITDESFFVCGCAGTGVVTSVPSDSPDDFAALRDLKKKEVSHSLVMSFNCPFTKYICTGLKQRSLVLVLVVTVNFFFRHFPVFIFPPNL